MSNDINFEAYLFVSPQKIIISINEKINFKTIYQKEILIGVGLKDINYEKVDNFLNDNIFLIEKRFQKFVKKISLIIELKAFFTVLVSIKDKNYDELISQKTLDHLLNEAKSQCQETIYGKKITHMIIDNYLINDKNHQFLTLDKKYNSLSLDLRFICLSKDIIKNFEQILSKYQISIDQIVNAEYIKKFFEYEKTDIFNMANKIINGCNENEVKIISKKYQKKGVFERLFHLFS